MTNPVRSDSAIVKASTGIERAGRAVRFQREKIRRHFRNERDQLPREDRADQSGDRADEHTFENKQPHHAPARRAQRHAQRDLAPASAEPNEQQIRDVAARDEQDKAHRGEKRGETGAQICRHIFRQRLDRS